MDRSLQAPSGENGREIVLLPGERIVFRVSDIVAVLQNDVWRLGIFYLTNYQLHFKLTSGPEIQAPLMAIESVKKITLTPEYHELKLRFKDFRMLKFTIQGKEIDVIYSYLTKWQNIDSINQLFAFEFKCPVSRDLNGWNIYDPVQEYERMGIPSSQWRISNVNAEYLLCDTYPQYIVVPAKISGQELMTAASFRAGGRIPVLVWKHPTKPTTISRCSQPLTGLTGNRCVQDEKLVSLIASSSPSQKLYIVDARPKKNAVANQMKGGGYENTLHYDKCHVTWASIPNIHVMYDSWLKLFRLLNKSSSDDSHWYATFEATGWMTHVRTILESVVNIVDLVDQENSVLLHCSDGWDRTPTLTSLAEICLDPYYRTLKGFIVLLEKDWLAFGHRYGDRCGHKESGQQSKQLLPKATKKQQKAAQHTPTLFSPIFMFFLDCVFQLLNQFPFAFEFNSNCLKALLDALYNCQYGTFLCNSDKERKQKMYNKTVSLWTLINANTKPYLNPFYKGSDQTLHPSCRMKHLVFWDDFYLRGWPGLQDHVFSSTRKTVFERCSSMLAERDNKIAQLEAELEKMKANQQALLQSVAQYKYQLGSIYSMVNQNILGSNYPADGTTALRKHSSAPPVASSTIAAATATTTTTPETIVKDILNDVLEEVYIQVLSKRHEAIYPESLANSSEDILGNRLQQPRANSENSIHDHYALLKERRGSSAEFIPNSRSSESLNAGVNPKRRSASLGPKLLQMIPDPQTIEQQEEQIRASRFSHNAALNDEANLVPNDENAYNSAKFSSAPHPQHRSRRKLFPDAAEANGTQAAQQSTNGVHIPSQHNGTHKGPETEYGSFQPRQPPEWIQDHVVSSCRGCASEFSALRRRHHCRNCGHVFCRQCCFERRSIHQLGFVKPVRVCQNCTKVLDQPASPLPTTPDKFSSLVFS